MAKTVIYISIFLYAATQIFAQNCPFKSLNEQCVLEAECCSSCCIEGVCSDAGGCFPVCNSTYDLGKEGPALCGLITTMNNIAGMLENMIEDVMIRRLPTLHLVELVFQSITKDPWKALGEMQELIVSLGDLFTLGGGCFPVCNSTYDLGKEGPAVCGLITTMNNIAGMLENMTEEVFIRALPTFHIVELFMQALSRDPFKAFGEMQELIVSFGNLLTLGGKMEQNLPIMMQLGRQMWDSLVQLFSVLTSNQF